MVEFRRGFERACELADDSVVIVPFYVKGLWGSQLSFAQGNLKNTADLRREIWVSFDTPLPRETGAVELKHRIFDLSAKTWETYSKNLPSLTVGTVHGLLRKRRKTVVIDANGNTMVGAQVLATAELIAKEFRQYPADNIGIMLPSGSAAIIANLAVLMAKKTPVNLNFTASTTHLRSSIEQACINEIITTDVFLSKLKEKGLNLASSSPNTKLVAVEGLLKKQSKTALATKLCSAHILPKYWYTLRYRLKSADTTAAAIIFTSGSNGDPKGVMLSHKSMMSNIKQINDVLDPQSDDIMAASLPPFHAFGLTVSLFMPIVEGITCVCQPDPTNARATAKLISKHRATMLFGSSTFLRLYLRDKAIHPELLGSLRIVVSGAEKLRNDVREGFQQKFGKDILEGYGATEVGPVASVNIFDRQPSSKNSPQLAHREGSVGMPLPGSSFKIVDPDTWQELDTEEEGMILITGPQMMMGYLGNHSESPSSIREIDGMPWYITGDKGRLDKDGFLWVVDRYSRFAKLGGEMVSLCAVETIAQVAAEKLGNQQTNDEDAIEVIATTITDQRKGEALVLLANKPLDRSQLRKSMQEGGASALMLPENIVLVEQIPKLGSGKLDYSAAKITAQNNSYRDEAKEAENPIS